MDDSRHMLADDRYMIGPDGEHIGLSQGLAQMLTTIASEQATTREQLKALSNTLEEQRQQGKTLAVLVESVKTQTDEIVRLRNDVDCIKQRPGKRWDSAVGTILAALITGIIGYFIAKQP